MPSLFDQDDNSLPTLDQSKNYLEELVGEGKKFKTVEELARGKAEADLYIQTRNVREDQLREDYLKLREELNAKAKFEDYLARLEAPERLPPQTPVETLERKPAYDPNEIKSLVQNTIREDAALAKADANFKLVQNKLKEQFGANTQQTLQERMESLDLTADDINNLARKSPTAFFNTLGLNQSTESLVPTPRSTFNSQGFAPASKTDRTWAYYEKMRKENPKAYHSQKITNQMHDDAVRLGPAFQDGDFNA